MPKPIRQQTLKQSTALLDLPAAGAAIKTELPLGNTISVYGSFKDYLSVSSGELTGWIRKL